jgi:hypothetical protein
MGSGTGWNFSYEFGCNFGVREDVARVRLPGLISVLTFISIQLQTNLTPLPPHIFLGGNQWTVGNIDIHFRDVGAFC